MLRRSFIHLPGIGQAAEKALWQKGIRDWDTLQANLSEIWPGEERAEKRTLINASLEESQLALARRDFHYFARTLPKREIWRLAPEHADRIAYLDIETTGSGFPPHSESTVIGFYYQGQLFQAHERERKRRLLSELMAEKPILCTFFGEGFDVPFLRREYPELSFDVAHIDLCFWLRRLGLKGGLKKIQKLFPEIPARQSMDIDGYDAVRLWWLHQRGCPGALETLTTYNAEDVVVLEPLLYAALAREKEQRPEAALDDYVIPPLFALSTRVHPGVYARLRGSSSQAYGEY